MAAASSPVCLTAIAGPLPYRVTGPILADDSWVVLRGMAPRVDIEEFEFIAR